MFEQDPLLEEQQERVEGINFPDIEPILGPSPISERQAKVMSTFAALAESHLGQELAQNDPVFFKTIQKTTLEKALVQGKDALRANYAEKLRVKRGEMNQSAAAESLIQADKRTAEDLFGLSQTQKDNRRELDDYAIEEATASAILDLAGNNPDQAALIEDALGEGDLIIQQEENTQKRLMISQMIREVYEEGASDSLIEKGIDLGSLFLVNLGIADFRTGTVGQAKEEPDDNTFFLNKGKKIWNQRLRLMEELSMDEFREELISMRQELREKSGLIFRNEPRELIALQNLVGFKEDDILLENAFVGLDIGLIAIPPALIATRAIKGVLDASKLLKNYEGLANTAAAKIANTGARKADNALTEKASDVPFNEIVTLDEALSASMPNFTPTADLVGNFNISNKVNSVLEQNQSFMRRLTDLRLPARLSPEETKVAVNNTLEQVRRQYKANVVEDYTGTIKDGRNVGSVEVFIGKQKGGGYVSKEGAMRAAASKNIDDFEIVNQDGFNFIKVTKPLDASGVIKGRPIEETQRVGIAKWILGGNRNIFPDDFFVNLRLSELAKVALTGKVIAPMMKTVQKLPRKQRVKLQDVLVRGDEEQKWFSKAELDELYIQKFDRLPSDAETSAYYTYKDINDLEYVLRNRAERIRMTEDEGLIMAGIETPSLTSGLPPQAAKHLRTGPELSRFANSSRAYDANEGRHILREELTQAKIDELIADGNEAILLRGMTKLPNEDDPVRLIFAKKGSFKITEIPTYVLGYRAGGHRLYENRYWLKQAKFGLFQNGDRFIERPITLANASSLKRAQKYAKETNEGLDAYRRWQREEITRTEALKIIEGSPLRSLDELEQMIKDGNISVSNETPIEVVFDRGDPESLEKLLAGNPVSFGDEVGQEALSSWYDLHGRSFVSKKGERVSNVQGEAAELIDPFTTTSRALQNAINHNVSIDFKITETQRWVREAEPFFKNSTELKGLSAIQKFLKADLGVNVRSADLSTRTKLSLKREKLRDILKFETTEGRLAKSGSRIVAESMEGIPIIGEKLGKFVLNLQDSNVTTALRGFAFDTKLGFFSPAQYMLQTQTSWAIKALDPLDVQTHMGRVAALRIASINGQGSMTEYLAKSKLLTGTDPKEFKQMVEALDRTQVAVVGNELAYIDNFTTQMGAELWRTPLNAYRTTRDAGRWLFFEAERHNRLAAFSLAWKRIRKADPDLDMLSDEALDLLTLKTDDLSMNMTTAGSAMWQRGLLSVPTQFQGYHMRLLEALLPEKLGGSKSIQGSDKAKLALGQTFLYGANGLPLMPYVADQYLRANGSELTPEQYIGITRGFWDSMIFNASDGEIVTDFAGRAGIGESLVDFYMNMIDKNMFELFGGPAVEITGDAINSVTSTLAVLSAGTVPTGVLVESRVRALANNLSVLSDAQQAELMWNYGITITNKMDIADKVERFNKYSAILTVLGFKPAAMNEIWEIKKDDAKFKKDVDDMVELARPLMMIYLRNPGDSQKRDQIIQQIADIGTAFAIDEPRKRKLYVQKMRGLLSTDDVMQETIQRSMSFRGPTAKTTQQLERKGNAREKRIDLERKEQQ